jgi:hypothetical protein
MSIRAFAWIHFATSAKHATSEQQQASVADAMMVEFDKRFTDEGATVSDDAALRDAHAMIARLEGERDSLQATIEKDTDSLLVATNKAGEFDQVEALVKDRAIANETVVETVERLVRTVAE